MDKEFKLALARLNDEQKKAVENIDGPLLVVAGPGTGKTELLSARVANILLSTDTEPFNILALTFTNKAAVNMKERIIKLAGSEGARVQVRTFHSFAGEVMNLYPDYFWNSAPLSVAPDSVQLDIIESIVKTLPLDNPLSLKFAGQYTLLNDIKKSIGLAKEAGLTPEKLHLVINGNLAYIGEIEKTLAKLLTENLSYKKLDALVAEVAKLPKMEVDNTIYPLRSLSTVISESLLKAVEQDQGTNKTSNTSKWKSRWLQNISGRKGMFAERKRNDWWLKLADVYEQYREAIHQRGFYDYADMLVEVISQLEQNPELKSDVQERFSYVLIDEFQDTNPAQLRLAHLVADHPEQGGKPNLMVVGDDDQSIFKFNGAELNNMLGFKNAYPTAKVIVLTKNYRSTSEVLRKAKNVIEQVSVRLIDTDVSLSKELEAGNPPSGNSKVIALSYSSRELQLSLIGKKIRRSYRPDRDIAVLARGHESLVRMSGILQQLGVPIHYEQASNILEQEVVEQVYLITKLLEVVNLGDEELGNSLIHQIIRHPLWGIKPVELWRLAKQNIAGESWLESLLASKNMPIKNLGEWFVWLSQQASNQPLAVTLEQIIGLRPSANFTSPIKSYFLINQKADANKYLRSLSAIQLLRSLVHEFAKQGTANPSDLVRFVEISRQNNIVVADESPFITGEQAVHLLTVHKAKGLEFDEVYIIDTIEDNWQPKKGGRKPPANLALQPVGDDFDDYIRLMYVAITRARANVTISSYHQDHAGKDISPSSIIQGGMEINRVGEQTPKGLVEALEQNLHWPDLSGGQERQMLKAQLATYSLSVTHLLNFLDLTKGGPQYFKERNLLRLPEAKTPSLAYGTAVHSALDLAQKQTNEDSFKIRLVTERFRVSLAAEQLETAEFERYTKRGEQMLTRLFSEFGYELPKGSVPEQNFTSIRVGKAVIGGKLDRVDVVGSGLRIVDYKTGTFLTNFESKDKNKALKAYKHKLQLIFYALLASEHKNYSRYRNIEGRMVYVDSEDKKSLELSYSASKDDALRLRRIIDAVWPMIVSMELPDVSGYSQDLEGILALEADLRKK